MLISGILNREDKKAFENGGYNTPNAWYAVKVHSWKTLGIMAGPDFIFRVSKKDRGLVLVPSIHAGVVKTSFPGDSVTYHSDKFGSLNDQINLIRRNKFPMRWAFCCQATVSIQYPLSCRLFFDFGIYYFSTAGLRSSKYDTDLRRFKVSTINILAGAKILL